MANRPKNQGTSRETKTVRKAEEWPGIQAHRAPNNAQSWDVTMRLDGLGPLKVEVKDRQQLNAHKVVKNAQAVNADQPVALLWHRTSKADGAKRSTPDGPTLMMVDEQLFYALASMASILYTAWSFREHSNIVEAAWDDTARVVERLDERYPGFRHGGL